MDTSPVPRPTVVVLHELFGLSDHARSVCATLEATGFTVIAPNLFERVGAPDPLPESPAGRVAGFALLDRLSIDEVADTVARALPTGPHDRVGLVGLSVGGYLGYRVAQHLPVDRSVLFYPGWLDSADNPLHDRVHALEQVGDPTPDTLVITGGLDALIPPESRDRIAQVITGPRHRLIVEREAGHGFLAEHRSNHDPAAATRSWARAIDWLRPTR